MEERFYWELKQSLKAQKLGWSIVVGTAGGSVAEPKLFIFDSDSGSGSSSSSCHILSLKTVL